MIKKLWWCWFIGCVLIPGPAYAACDFAWTTNTESDLAGYRLYLEGGAVVAEIAAPATAYNLPICAVGERYYLTAFDVSMNESLPSNTVEVLDNVPPLAPTGFGVGWSP